MKPSLLVCLAFVVAASAQAQKLRFEHRLGLGSFTHRYGLVQVDAGPDWKGSYLPDNDKTGFQVSAGSGIRLGERWYIGASGAYARYENINGMLASGNIIFDLLKLRFTPFVLLGAGYSHFWNQYPGGTGTEFFEYGVGLKYKLKTGNQLRLSAGGQAMQMNYYFAVKAAYGFR